jgi:hypothetical protein
MFFVVFGSFLCVLRVYVCFHCFTKLERGYESGVEEDVKGDDRSLMNFHPHGEKLRSDNSYFGLYSNRVPPD